MDWPTGSWAATSLLFDRGRLDRSLPSVQAQVAALLPPTGDEDRFSDSQFDLARETPPICLKLEYVASVLLFLNHGLGSGVSCWTNAFFLDVFSGEATPCGVGINLLSALCKRC